MCVSVPLQVPPGVDTGSRLRVRGGGNAGRRGGEPGDLYVYINVKEHPEMRREGNNIHSDVEVGTHTRTFRHTYTHRSLT